MSGSPSSESSNALGAASGPPSPEDFARTLEGLTPRVWVVPTIVVANVGLFGVMVASGVHFLEPTAESLVSWGANFGMRTSAGEWWRLGSSMFVHIGVFHVLLNMWALWDAGKLVERLIGNVGFLLMYLACGLAGSLASVAWNPTVVSAGASGAVFGVYGALLGILARQRRTFPVKILSKLANSTLVFVGYNLVFGFVATGIDVAAHLGGLAAGFFCGLALSQPFLPEAAKLRWRRDALFALGAMALLAAGAYLAPRTAGDFRAALDHFREVETRAVSRFNDSVKQMQEEKISGAEMARVLETEILPPWRALRDRFAKLGSLPGKLERQKELLLAYLTKRQEAWEIQAPALREENLSKVLEARQKNVEADKILEELKDLTKK